METSPRLCPTPERSSQMKTDAQWGTAVTLGKFDGLHRGHQKLLGEILRLQSEGYYGIVFAIAPENQTVLFTPEEKRHMLETYGIDCMIRCPFVPEILSMEPESFIADVLCAQLHAKQIVVGTDFRFGYQRKGDVDFLRAMQEKYEYTLCVMEKERFNGREISSTYIREALAGADMELVRNLMGNFYTVEGTILHGHQLGRKIGMPTINLRPEPYKLLPPPGVYYSDVIFPGKEASREGKTQKEDDTRHTENIKAADDSQHAGNIREKDDFRRANNIRPEDMGLQPDQMPVDGENMCILHGITNIGYKPTVDGSFLGIETYLYGTNEDLYGQNVKVLLRSFRRPEQKFTSVEELKAQMERDIQSGKEYFGAG